MKLEKQVCSFELAKKLKELGVKKGFWFYWHKFGGHEPAVVRHDVSADNHNTIASAFTVAELGRCCFILHREKVDWDIIHFSMGKNS